METMADRLRLIREDSGLSTRAFSERLGMTAGAISMLETGKRQITTKFLTSMCKEYNVDVDWFTNGTGQMHPVVTKEKEIADIVKRLYKDEDETFIRLVKALSVLSPDQIQLLIDVAKLMVGKEKEPKE